MKRDFLKELGLENEVVNSIMAEHGKGIEAIKQQNNTDNTKLSELQATIAELKTDIVNKENSINDLSKYKADYESTVTEYNNFKTNVETEKSNLVKNNLVIEGLKKEGFNDKIINLLAKNIDINKLDVEDNSIKGWDGIIEPLKAEYADFIPTTTTEGAPPATPPAAIKDQTFTREQIANMTEAQINQNWGVIQKSLSK